jgi:hypothetical protein
MVGVFSGSLVAKHFLVGRVPGLLWFSKASLEIDRKDAKRNICLVQNAGRKLNIKQSLLLAHYTFVIWGAGIAQLVWQRTVSWTAGV